MTMRTALLGICILLLSAGGAGMFRLRGSETWNEWTGRGAGTARWAWAVYLALCAWLVDGGPAVAWGSPVAACWPGHFGSWPFVLVGSGYGAREFVPALCAGVRATESVGGTLVSVPVPVLLPVLAAAVWAGAADGGWWGSLDMGTHEGTLARDLPLHSLRGLLWTGPAALVLWMGGLGSPWLLLLAGALCGPIYYACLRLWPRSAVQAGEWAFGGAFALALLTSAAST